MYEILDIARVGIMDKIIKYYMKGFNMMCF